MSRFTAKALIVAVTLGAAALAGEPASATPMAGAAAIEQAAPAAVAGAEQVFFYGRRGYYRRPFFRRRFYGPGYRRFGYGYRRGLPGHPIRRLLRHL